MLFFIELNSYIHFQQKALVKELKPYAKNAKFYWCQEEPKNMGAWFSVRDYIQWTLDNIKANNNKFLILEEVQMHLQQQDMLKDIFLNNKKL